MDANQSNKRKKLAIIASVLTIIASIATIVAAICAVSGFSVFRSISLFEDKTLIPDPLTDSYVRSNEESDDVSEVDFLAEAEVRLANSDDKTWQHFINANVGDIVEFQIQYRNLSKQTHKDVMIRNILPDNLEYIEDSTILYNSNHPDGISIVQNDVITSGINIGHYRENGNAYVRFSTVVVDKSLQNGRNILYNWSQAGVKEITLQDYACVFVQLDK